MMGENVIHHNMCH